MIVLDASAFVEFLLATQSGARVNDRLAVEGESLHVPHVFDLEIASALRTIVRAGVLSPRRAEEALVDLGRVVLTRYPHAPLLTRIWTLHERASAYDAAYIGLAEALDAPLLPRDRRMAGIAGHRARIELI